MMNFLQRIEFEHPEMLLLLALPLLYILWQIFRYKKLYPTLSLPILAGLEAHRKPFRGFLKKYLFIFRALAVVFMVVALARPRTSLNEENIETEGIDIILSLDISGSMNALDFRPDRLEAAKAKALEFITQRPNDRIGLVVFAGESYTQCPLTTDTAMVKKLLVEVQQGIIEDGTAIGMGLANAVLRLKESDAKSRVVILLTDGVNNSGQIDPNTAVETALQYGVRVYTIGVGSNGTAPFAMKTPFGQTVTRQVEVELDETLLRSIAEKTGGKYFQARNNRALGDVYAEIDRLEKTRMQVTRTTRHTEEFHWFLIIGGIILLFEMILRYAIVRSIP
ncbi:MAG: VWA domain-containing protein [Bacteroidia bacterium]|nr:VWA domain-containing protein [Bacteroidia bacterium]